MNVISDDPYVYPPPHHNVLRNLADIRQAEAFSKFETRATARRIASLIEEPIPGNFDTDHLRAIHGHIFQDVYAWAGEYRTGPLMKSEYIGGPVSTFAPPQRIATELIALFRDLADKDCLKGLPRKVFTHEAARFLCRLNSVHPFREGNGRTQLLFASQLAEQAGHPLDFRVVSKQRMLDASIDGHKDNVSTMIRLLEEISTPSRVSALSKAIAFLDRNGYDWNNRYVATTVPGQTYEGSFVSAGGDDFMLIQQPNRIIIGHTSDLPKLAQSGKPIAFTAY